MMKTRLLAECQCVQTAFMVITKRTAHKMHGCHWPGQLYFQLMLFSFFFVFFYSFFLQHVGFGFAVQMFVCHKRSRFEQKGDSAISFAEGRAVYCAIEGMMN